MTEKPKKKIKKTTILKIAFLIFIVSVVIYTFRDQGVPIIEQILQTPFYIIVLICLAAFLYEVVEGWITCTLSRIYNPEFSLLSGFACSLYCCFYRLASAGTGTGLAAVFFLSDHGVEYSKATGMYTIEYVFHRLGMILISLIAMAIAFPFMLKYYTPHRGLLILGYCLTTLLSVFLLVICLSKWAHKKIHRLVDRINRKGKIDRYVDYINNEIDMFEMGSRDLFEKKSRIVVLTLQSTLKHFFWDIIPFIVLFRFCGIGFFDSLAVTSLSVMLSAVIPALGGIGSTEFVFIMMFSVVVNPALAGSAALLYRFGTFIFLFLVGIPVAIPQRKKHKPLFIKEEIRKY